MDIVDRLKRDPGSYVCIKREAAQEIEALRKQIAIMKDEQRMALTSPSTARRWLTTLARHYPSLLVSGVCHNALAELDALTAERDAYRDAPALKVEMGCTGCVNAPTEAAPNYNMKCLECRRFYGDLYKGESK